MCHQTVATKPRGALAGARVDKRERTNRRRSDQHPSSAQMEMLSRHICHLAASRPKWNAVRCSSTPLSDAFGKRSSLRTSVYGSPCSWFVGRRQLQDTLARWVSWATRCGPNHSLFTHQVWKILGLSLQLSPRSELGSPVLSSSRLHLFDLGNSFFGRRPNLISFSNVASVSLSSPLEGVALVDDIAPRFADQFRRMAMCACLNRDS